MSPVEIALRDSRYRLLRAVETAVRDLALVPGKQAAAIRSDLESTLTNESVQETP